MGGGGGGGRSTTTTTKLGLFRVEVAWGSVLFYPLCVLIFFLFFFAFRMLAVNFVSDFFFIAPNRLLYFRPVSLPVETQSSVRWTFGRGCVLTRFRCANIGTGTLPTSNTTMLCLSNTQQNKTE